MSEDTRTRQGRRRKGNPKNRKPADKAVFKKVFISLVVLFAILLAVGSFTVYSIIKDAPPLDPDKLTLAQNPEIFDQNDELFTTLSASENRRLTDINEIPQLLEDAFISVEDVRFREHFGIDIRRIGGAIKANITGGFGAQGASTITQQVVKNLYLSTDKKLTRKIQEQYLAIKLEQLYHKDQILEMYLNAIYFSQGAYGVVEAADRYFSKSLDELTVEDAALLAGIPQRPNYYNPFKNPEAAQERRDIVITLMERHGKITKAEAVAAKAVAVESQLKQPEKDDDAYSAFLDQVLEEVEAIEGITANDVYTGGLKIYTTLDQDAQTYTEQLLQNYDYPDEYFQAGLTVVDIQTGQIKAIGSGRQKDNVKRGYNWATDPQRQPGSTIKPILDYGPAIEYLKWSTYHQITDEPHQYSNGTSIRNYNDKYSGDVSMRYALQKSLNIPAVKAFQAVGKDKAAEFGKDLGIPLDTIEEPYSLGGFTTGISSLQLAGAYAAFANEGAYHKPYAVRKVVFQDRKTIDLTPETTIAMSDYTAFMITDMLKSAVSPSGTGNKALVSGVPMAGKTGTSNFSTDEKKRYNISNGAKDIWFAGYSTNYAIAVWTGYDTPEEGYIKYDGRQDIAKYLFRDIMTEISKEIENHDFKQPNSVIKVGVEKATGLLPSENTPSDEIVYEYFVKGTEPTEVSELFATPAPPLEFTGSYNEFTDQIILSWTYPEEERENYSFELQLAVNDGENETVSLSDEMQHIIFNPEGNSDYQFKLFAIYLQNEELRSDPVELLITIPDKGNKEEPGEDLEEDQTTPDNDLEEEIPDPIDDLIEGLPGNSDEGNNQGDNGPPEENNEAPENQPES